MNEFLGKKRLLKNEIKKKLFLNARFSLYRLSKSFAHSGMPRELVWKRCARSNGKIFSIRISSSSLFYWSVSITFFSCCINGLTYKNEARCVKLWFFDSYALVAKFWWFFPFIAELSLCTPTVMFDNTKQDVIRNYTCLYNSRFPTWKLWPCASSKIQECHE